MTAGQILFPLFVRTKDSGEIASFNSVHELQFHLERIDVENQEYEAWDSEGHPVALTIEEPLWLKASPRPASCDENGLRRALLDFGNSLGIQLPEDLGVGNFEGALKQIRNAQETGKLTESPVRRFISRLKK